MKTYNDAIQYLIGQKCETEEQLKYHENKNMFGKSHDEYEYNYKMIVILVSKITMLRMLISDLANNEFK